MSEPDYLTKERAMEILAEAMRVPAALSSGDATRPTGNKA